MLENVDLLQDLKRFSILELKNLCSEIRDFLVKNVSKTGGHLAPSLGTVELSVALHHVFDSPKDKIIWDVGHQAYAHKILTGRKSKFHSLRQLDGISGFPRMCESEHDPFGVGHSSTSISAALGMALARDRLGKDNKVIAVIGDGALTGGMAFEALNHAGSLKSDMLVILNDNKMSIAKNVGAMSSYLNRIVSSPKYHDAKHKAERFIKKNFGKSAARLLRRLEEHTRTFKNSGMLFEELGFKYVGPVDGHDMAELVKTLFNLKSVKGPKLLHIITKKGRGYRFAEQDSCRFHGIGAFDVYSGENKKSSAKSSGMTYTDVFGRTMMKIAEMDDKVTAITAAMPHGTGLCDFALKFKSRFFDVGIAEQHAVTLAAGMKASGLRPVVAIYSTFLQRAYDQILHDVCLQNLGVVFCLDRAGIVGEDGATHHGVFDISYLRHMPNMIVMAPKDENELRHMLYSAIYYEKPTAIRYPRGSGVGVPLDQEFRNINIGESELLLDGKDCIIVGIGSMVNFCYDAAMELRRKGVKAAAVNARFVKPIDIKLLNHIKKVKKVLVVEENAVIGGFGSALLEELNRHNIKADVRLLGIKDEFIEHGDAGVLRQKAGLSVENIMREVKRLI